MDGKNSILAANAAASEEVELEKGYCGHPGAATQRDFRPRVESKPKSRESVALISLYPLNSLGGGEFFTLNALKAVAVAGARCRLYSVQEPVTRSRPAPARLQTQFVRAFDSETQAAPSVVSFSQVLAESAEFDSIWVHQYLSNDLIFDFIASAASDQQLLLTNLGHEPLRDLFGRIYQPSPNHWCAEISDFAAGRSTYTRQRAGIAAAVWSRDCQISMAKPRPFGRRICVVGRVLPHKGVDVTIKALPEDFDLNIIGSLEHDPAYTAHLRNISHGRRANFLGALEESAKRQVLESSDVLVASSCLKLYDGRQIEQAELLGLVIMEAVMAGALPITSDLPPFREVMETLGLQNFIYPQRDADALQTCLRRYESMPTEQQAELRQNAWMKMRKHFLWDDYWQRVREATIIPAAA